MATTYQNHSRSIKHPTVQKSQTKKSISKQLPSTMKNNSTNIKTRFGNNSIQNSMYKPSTLLKRKPLEQPSNDHFNENVADWHQPSNLESIQSKPFHTPSRLRKLVTPPGAEPYRNHYNLRQPNNPLPALDDWYSPPVNLDTWGLDSTDYRLNTNFNLNQRYPSPLSRYSLGSIVGKQKKSYTVVPRLNNFVSPPLSRGDDSFTLPSRRIAPIYAPDSQYTYLERIHSFASPQLHREPSDYVYVRQNEAFANHYIENFIGKCIEDQFIPDILLEIIGELDQENKKQGGKTYKTKVDRYYAELNKRISQGETANTHLFSDDWVRELDYKRPPIPTSNIDSKKLADINQELIDLEVQNMTTKLTGQTLSDRFHNDNKRDIYHNIEPKRVREVIHDTTYDVRNTQRYQIQYNTIEKYAQNKVLDTICLDELIMKYIKQHGSFVDIDELSRLLDGNILGNLIYQYQNIDEIRSRTLDNYGSRKFHLNSFMNTTMDLLLTELSASLIEDMKDLDEQERRRFS